MTFPFALCSRCGHPLAGLRHDGYVHTHCPRRGFLAWLLRRKPR
jgi:phage FluMu protein Com